MSNFIDDDIWNDINDFLRNENNNFSNSYSMEFGVPFASGFRFRYLSEIEKKSFSSLKDEKNQFPTIKIQSQCDVMLKIELVTEGSTNELISPHFYTLYEVSKNSKCSIFFQDGMCFILIKKSFSSEIKLDFLGIRKWKSKEAIPRIMELYPNMKDSDAKKFFNENKESVKVRISMLKENCVCANLLSHTIKSQNVKESKEIKIQYITPKIVADNCEKLIIILEKKITSRIKTILKFDNNSVVELNSTYEDGQTFVFPIPPYTLENPITATIRIECLNSNYFDETTIRFIQCISEARKRKFPHHENEIPLKRPTNYDSPHQLYPESGSHDYIIELDKHHNSSTSKSSANSTLYSEIEYDGPQSMNITESVLKENTSLPQGSILGHDCCKDSGVHSDNKSSDDDSEDDQSLNDSDDENDDIQIDGNRRKRNNPVEKLEPINFPPTKRAIDSKLEQNRKDQVSNKIFSEVARIGHDFAFGKDPTDIFLRIERQLPVVFTLQDDVGDTPLNNAILKGNFKQAEHILKIVHDECSWALDLVNTSGHTALILAPACDVPCNLIKMLLDAGCRLDMYDDLGKSAITYAIEYKNTEALEVLLQYVKNKNMHWILKRQKKVYFSLLQIAVMNNYFDGVKLLLSLQDINGKYMVDVNEVSLMNLETALTIAVERGVGLNIIRMLLERSDVKVNHKKDNKFTALHTALEMKSNDVIALLKSYKGEDICEIVDSEEVVDSSEEMEDEEDRSSLAVNEMCPVVEVNSQNESMSENMFTLTTKMECMNLNEADMHQLIYMLLNGDTVLTVRELIKITPPICKTLLSKYDDSEQYKHEIIDMLERFNCLPNSLGQLIYKLKEINRVDIINKVAKYFVLE